MTGNQYPTGSRGSPSRRSDGQRPGYHLCVNKLWKRVTIHAPTDREQHLPRRSRNNGYWLGPFDTENGAQDEAQEAAEQHDYEVHRCRKCFHTPEVLSYWQRQARERMARGDWLPGIGEQPTRKGMWSSRSR